MGKVTYNFDVADWPPKYPPSPPYLCEALFDSFGAWLNGGQVGTSGVELSTFFDSRRSPNQYSVRKWQTARNAGVDGLIIFEFRNPLNLAKYDYIVFSHANNGYASEFRIIVEDVDGRRSNAQFWVSLSVKAFGDVALSRINFLGVDFTRIRRILIYGDVVDEVFPKEHFIDWMYLIRVPQQYTILINSSPQSKFVKITGPAGVTSGYTPFSVVLTQYNGTSYTIEIDPNRFEKWEDNSTNPTRIYVPTADATLFATYTPIIKYTLKIDSTPAGVSFTIDSVGGITPTTYTLSPGQYTVKMNPTNFKEWADLPSDNPAKTNPTRTVNISADTELTAVYTALPSACFIATAAYGTPLAPQLIILRRFRDRYLPSTLTNLYYTISPPIAQLVRRSKPLRVLIRNIIDFII